MSISRRAFIGSSAALLMGAVMAGCNANDSSDNASVPSSDRDEIKIGIRADMVNQYAAVEDRIKALGYNVSSVVFDDSVQPNVALGEGSIDCNWYQHEPYMQSYNEKNGTDFVMVQPKTFYPLFAMYSTKHDSVDAIPDGATFGLCNDATNQARGLNLLAAKGLIAIPDGVETPAIIDITGSSNPRNFGFIEAEMSVLPQSVDDVDAICLAAGHMVNAGKPADGYIAQSEDNEIYAVGFVVRKADEDAEWIKEIAKAVQCDELAAYFLDEKQGTQIPAWL